MATSKTYTERIAVRIPTRQRDEMEAQLGDVGLAAALRDAALRALDREDLILVDPRNESGHRNRERRSRGAWVVIPVPLTTAQKAAFEKAAKDIESAVSTLILASLLEELKLSGERGSRRGWEFGKRKSDIPTFSPKDKAAVVEYARANGVSAATRQYHLNHGTVYAWADSIGVAIRRVPLKQAEKRAIVEYARRHNGRSAARHFDIGRAKVYKLCEELGVDLAASKRQRRQ